MAFFTSISDIHAMLGGYGSNQAVIISNWNGGFINHGQPVNYFTQTQDLKNRLEEIRKRNPTAVIIFKA